MRRRAAGAERRSHGVRGAVLSVTLLATAIAALARAEDAPTALLACRALPDDSQRLACFDRESARLAGTGPHTDRPPTGQDNFGLSEAAIAARSAPVVRPPEVQAIHARLTSITDRGDGHLVFRLDNGEVWRQLEPGNDLLAQAGDLVQVSKGALGSYWLRLSSGRGCRVSRER